MKFFRRFLIGALCAVFSSPALGDCICGDVGGNNLDIKVIDKNTRKPVNGVSVALENVCFANTLSGNKKENSATKKTDENGKVFFYKSCGCLHENNVKINFSRNGYKNVYLKLDNNKKNCDRTILLESTTSANAPATNANTNKNTETGNNGNSGGNKGYTALNDSVKVTPDSGWVCTVTKDAKVTSCNLGIQVNMKAKIYKNGVYLRDTDNKGFVDLGAVCGSYNNDKVQLKVAPYKENSEYADTTFTVTADKGCYYLVNLKKKDSVSNNNSSGKGGSTTSSKGGTDTTTTSSTSSTAGTTTTSGDGSTAAGTAGTAAAAAGTSGNGSTTTCENKVGQKECSGAGYSVCTKDSDCTGSALPANATAGHCVAAGRNGYKICTATACSGDFEAKSGYCKKKTSTPAPDAASSAAVKQQDAVVADEPEGAPIPDAGNVVDEAETEDAVANDSGIQMAEEVAEPQPDPIADAEQNYEDAKDKETSTANRMLGGLSMGATGIGGMELAQGLTEQSADKDAARDMDAYLATMQCRVGDNTYKLGDAGIDVGGTNQLVELYQQYVDLAADLKERKNALGMKAGIESQVVMDSAKMGLYDDKGSGIENGTYASLYRASRGNEKDKKAFDDDKDTSRNRVKYGTIAAGVGVVGGVIGNELINGDDDEKVTEEDCKKVKGTYKNGKCTCPEKDEVYKNGKCIDKSQSDKSGLDLSGIGASLGNNLGQAAGAISGLIGGASNDGGGMNMGQAASLIQSLGK